MKSLSIKSEGKWCLYSITMEVLEKLYSEVGTATNICCYCVNKRMIYFIKNSEDNIKGTVKANVPSSAISCKSLWPLLWKDGTGPLVCWWKMEHRKSYMSLMLLWESRPCGYRTTMQSMGESERAASVPVSNGITKADLSSCFKNSTFSFILSNTCFLLEYTASDGLFTYIPGVYIRKS